MIILSLYCLSFLLQLLQASSVRMTLDLYLDLRHVFIMTVPSTALPWLFHQQHVLQPEFVSQDYLPLLLLSEINPSSSFLP